MRPLSILASLFLLAVTPMTALTQGEVIANASKALGSLDPAATYHAEFNEQHGSESTREVLDRRGNEFVRVYVTDGIAEADGFYHGQPWSLDPNGALYYTRVPRAVEPVLLPHISTLESTQPASRDADGNYVVTVGQGSTSQSYVYDAATFLPKRIERRSNGRTTIAQYSDYRRIDSAMRPFHIEWGGPRPNDRDTMTTQTYARVRAEQAPMGMPPASAIFTTDKTEAFDVNARFDRSGIIVPVIINGRTMDFYLDSGDAEGMSIDADAAHDLGLSIVDRGKGVIGGEFNRGRAVADTVSIGALTAKKLVFDVIPFSHEAGYSRVVGLIGSDFFASAIVQIDYGAEKVTVIPRSAFKPQSIGTLPLHATLDDGLVQIPAWINGNKGYFALDTGASYTYISKNFSTKLGLGGADCVGDEAANFIGGSVRVKYCDVSNLILGTTKYKNGRVMIAKSDAVQVYDGLIGHDILEDFIITFDYQASAVYLKLTP